MLTTLLMASSLLVGQIPEAPVAPAAEPPAPDRYRDERYEQERRYDDDRNRGPDRDKDNDGIDDRKEPSTDFRALGTVTIPMGSTRESQRDFLLGVRGELDIKYFSALFSWDRQGFSPISLDETLTETSYWNGLVGGSVWATRYHRVRVLGGISAVSDYRKGTYGPTIGTTARFGIPIVAIEGAVLYTPFGGFQQVDGRMELVVRLLIVELRGGYRARWVEMKRPFDQPFADDSGGWTFSAGLVF
jgi:hypothetical protein